MIEEGFVSIFSSILCLGDLHMLSDDAGIVKAI
jgi:hypothetical protein